MKSCGKCKEVKPPEEFYKYKRSSDGRQSYCKSCNKVANSVFSNTPKRQEYRKTYRENNLDRVRAREKAYREANKEAIKASDKAYRELNRDKIKESQANYVRRHKDRVLKSSSEYRKRNLPKYNMYSSHRRACVRRAQPLWLSPDDKKRMELVWGLRELKSFVTGVEYEVDHIVPLNSPVVCGLHVPWNLRVIPKSENRSKSNRIYPDMWELDGGILMP